MIYGAISGLRGQSYNQDTENYIKYLSHISSISSFPQVLLDLRYEPGFAVISKILSVFNSVDIYLLLLSLLISASFSIAFLKVRLNPTFISYIFCTTSAIGFIAPIRYYLGLSLCTLFFSIKPKSKGLSLLIPGLFNVFAAPFCLFMYLKYALKEKTKVKLVIITFIVLIALNSLPLFFILQAKFVEALDYDPGSSGLRVIFVLYSYFLGMYNPSKNSISINFLNVDFLFYSLICVSCYLFAPFGRLLITASVLLLFTLNQNPTYSLKRFTPTLLPYNLACFIGLWIGSGVLISN